jgi:hypothetical protein
MDNIIRANTGCVLGDRDGVAMVVNRVCAFCVL